MGHRSVSPRRYLQGFSALAEAGAQEPAAAALACEVMGLYPQVPAFRSASTACAAVISGVVWMLCTAPPAAKAMARAAAEMLSGISVMAITSKAPNAKKDVTLNAGSAKTSTKHMGNIPRKRPSRSKMIKRGPGPKAKRVGRAKR